jgi:hypothetical protein
MIHQKNKWNDNQYSNQMKTEMTSVSRFTSSSWRFVLLERFAGGEEVMVPER